ncbi:MAG: DUF3808 domain-containing protein [Elusimicrobia bacterium]|nr:DUF3808 domain-containing protein [Elusimicrobiota bacterium]
MKRALTLALSTMIFVVSAAPPAFAAEDDNPFHVSKELDADIREGLNQLYNLNFDEGAKIFERLKPQADEHPMIAFGLTSVHWWRLSVYVLENDPVESAPFLKSVDECIRASKLKIQKGDPTGEGYLCLGGAEGLLGRWEAANRHWTSAYFKGKGAVNHLHKALKANPKMIDAYMGLGIFDYYVATLPAIVRMLAFIGQTGNRQLGLDELEECGKDGTYARTPSLLFLVNIYSALENKPERALGILADLRKQYPTSPFIHMLTIVALYNHRTPAELEAEAKEFHNRVENGTYRKDFMTQADFSVGLVSFKKKDWKTALDRFTEAINAGTVKDPFFTWAHLYRGYCLDVLGRREEAVKEYNTVLGQLKRWGAQDNAAARLKKPFTEDEKELTKLIL